MRMQVIFCAAAVLEAAGLAPAGEPVRPPAERAAEGRPAPVPILVLPRPGLQGKRVKLPGGIVSLRQVLGFLSDFAGLPVALEAEEGRPAQKAKPGRPVFSPPGPPEGAVIDLGAERREVGGEEILLILEALHHRAGPDRLPGGREVIRVEAIAPRSGGAEPAVPEGAPKASLPGKAPLLPVGREPKLKKIFISQGSIRLVDFARVLSDLTGLPLLLDSSDTGLAGREILIAADIPDADVEVVRAILEVNRIRNFEETLPGGKTILRVESMAPAGAGPEDPRPTPIIVVPSDSW